MAEVQKKDKTKEVNSKKRNLDNVTEQSNNDNKSMQEPKSKKQRREVSNNDTDENKNECENGNEQEEEFTKQDFMKEANNIDIECFNKKIALKPRCNDTGSVGWHGSKRTAINIEKKKLDCLFNFHITVCKSAEWREGETDCCQNDKSQCNSEDEDDENENENEKEDKTDKCDTWNQEDFLKAAKENQVRILTQNVTLKPKINSTNTLGWHGSKKIQICVKDKTLPSMVNFNITIYKSAQWPKDNKNSKNNKNYANGNTAHEKPNDTDEDNDVDNDKNDENNEVDNEKNEDNEVDNDKNDEDNDVDNDKNDEDDDYNEDESASDNDE